MFPYIPTGAILAAQEAAKKAIALEKKKRAREESVRKLGSLADQFAAGSLSRASALQGEAAAAQAELARLQGEGSAAAGGGESGPGGFFRSKGLLIVAGLVVVLLFLRRRR